MTKDEIIIGLNNLRGRRYTTGVLHTSSPQWIIDLGWCIKVIEFLLENQK